MPLKQNWTDRDTVTATFLNQLASAVNSAVASLAGKYTKPAGGIPASDLAGNVLDKTTADTIYAPRSSAVGEYDYDSNGNVIATPDGTTYTWETDGAGGFRVKTETVAGVTRNFTYNPNGTLGSVA